MSEGSVGKGVGVGVLATVFGIAVGAVLMAAGGIIILFGIGLAQLLWMVPVGLHYRNCGERETVKGLAIVAGLVFLLNASCWGVVMSGKLRIGG